MSEEQSIDPDVKMETVTQDENNVPISRLNEVIAERNNLRNAMQSLKTQEEEKRKADLADQEKWQELNTELSKEVDSYKPYKEKWESMDAKIRETALSKLPESKREKFSSVDTEVLLDIVQEFADEENKVNPPDRQGTVPTKQITDWTDMDAVNRRRNWGAILESYIKR